jgi:hypothetical protein
LHYSNCLKYIVKWKEKHLWSIYEVKLEKYKCMLLVFSVPGDTCVRFVHNIGIRGKDGWKALYLCTNVTYKSAL